MKVSLFVDTWNLSLVHNTPDTRLKHSIGISLDFLGAAHHSNLRYESFILYVVKQVDVFIHYRTWMYDLKSKTANQGRRPNVCEILVTDDISYSCMYV